MKFLKWEVGNTRWATPERDPRILIDKSIREIAAQFAIGRFYTRRTIMATREYTTRRLGIVNALVDQS